MTVLDVYEGPDGLTILIIIDNKKTLVDVILFLSEWQRDEKSFPSRLFAMQGEVRDFSVISSVGKKIFRNGQVLWELPLLERERVIDRLKILLERGSGHYYFEGGFYENLECIIKFSYLEV